MAGIHPMHRRVPRHAWVPRPLRVEECNVIVPCRLRWCSLSRPCALAVPERAAPWPCYRSVAGNDSSWTGLPWRRLPIRVVHRWKSYLYYVHTYIVVSSECLSRYTIGRCHCSAGMKASGVILRFRIDVNAIRNVPTTFTLHSMWYFLPTFQESIPKYGRAVNA